MAKFGDWPRILGSVGFCFCTILANLIGIRNWFISKVIDFSSSLPVAETSK